MNKFIWCIFTLSICLIQLTLAQDIPPVYSQFYMNPTVYNPAFAGSDGYASLYLIHRRQWIGIEGAPVTSTVNFHTPLSEKTATGLQISHDQAGIIQNTSAEGVFAYIIPFGKQHHLRMGLGAGVNRQNLDLTDATDEQRAYLASRTSGATAFVARFGLNYHLKNLNVGISTNNLFRNNALASNSEQGLSVDPLQDLVINAIYYISVTPDKLHLEPYLIHHRFGSYQRNEGGLLVYFRDTFWTGASYRSDYGMTGYFGLNLKDVVKFAYAYELGNNAIGGFSNSTHELQIAIKLGKEKNFSKEVVRKPRFEF